MMGRFLSHWGIATRLLVIAVLPASIMFVSVTATLSGLAQRDVRRDVAARGQLVATALAQSSQYGLVSGNTAYLRTTLRHMLEADPSIACIAIADAVARPVVSDCQVSKPTEVESFEVPIRIESLPQVDQFEPVPTPSGEGAWRTVGSVRVTMSPAPIFESKRRALLVAFALVLAAAVVSCLIGLRLARRLRDILGSVMSALRDIRQGRFDVQLATDHEGELGELQRTIVQMASTLDASRHDLEQQVAKRTQQLQEAVDLARQADADKRRLIVRSNALVEEERRRIALDIHDHLGAALISVRLEASALVARARACGDAEMQGDAARIAAAAQSIYATTRDIVKRLRPEVIDTLGLAGAVEELVRHADQVHPAARFTFQVDPGFPDVRGELAMPAYRVAQEALNNIAKHSDATLTTVTLSVLPETGHLRMVIQDNGRGFDTRSPRSTGIGLIGMRERVAAVGGELLVSSTPGQGTTVCVTLPLPAGQ
ncbi:MAG: histidine kinase [Aquabacterium sp.]|uniref:HAMP domain-containing sensor histidine kinase n=1 Tax=Aquabacterium sp. TaxID=1872578 RepID=UPI002722B0E2|nr:ATP-binding protein [Aquabacterium sp.]MDO9005334.1 histidine kinase [Aquabacterium sp.]